VNISFKNLLILVEFALVILRTNAEVQRVTSVINSLWTQEKYQRKAETFTTGNSLNKGLTYKKLHAPTSTVSLNGTPNCLWTASHEAMI